MYNNGVMSANDVTTREHIMFIAIGKNTITKPKLESRAQPFLTIFRRDGYRNIGELTTRADKLFANWP